MTFRDCIDNAEKEGRISKSRADELRDEYERNYRELELEEGADAANEAARRTFDAAVFEAKERRRRKLLQAERGAALMKAQNDFRNFKGEADPGEFLINLIEDSSGKLSGQSSVTGRYKAIRGRAHARMQAAIEKFERDALTRTRNKATLRDVVRAAFGGDASAEGKELAAAWGNAAEFLRRRFNAAGGHIGKLESWGLPQFHDAIAIARAGYENWRGETMPRLDRTRMIDRATGKPFTDETLELALRETYETISTGGANKRTPSAAPRGRPLGNRRADHRFLIFKSGDDWLSYQERFGQADAFAAMMHHIDIMARETAEMEILGPNPMSSLRQLADNAEIEGRKIDAKGLKKVVSASGVYSGKADYARAAAKTAFDMYAIHTGSASAPVNGYAARAIRATRDFLTSAQLGSAALSAISDVNTQRMTRAFNGLPQTKALRQTINFMLPSSKTETADAVRAGLIADGAAQIGLAQTRYLGEIDATGATRRLADGVLRLSLLSPWTQGGRWAFGMEFLGALASRSAKSIEALRAGGADDKAFARALDRYGLSGAWDEIRSTPAYEPKKGAAFLRPEDITARTDLPPGRADYLANRLLEMVQAETDYAVPTASLRARAYVTGATPPGTVFGELLRSAAMYKAFPTTMTYLTASRAMQEGALRAGGYGFSYLATMTFGMTMFGALALQMREISAGRDPRPMNTWAFWGAAMLQGGGLGLFGDFLFSGTNRFGGGLGESVSGPVVSAANTVRELTFGNAMQIAAGDDPRLGRDVIRALKGNTPGGNIWYLKLVYSRMLLDQLQKWADPDADQDFARQINYREREYGNGYFWAPGEALPERAPDLLTAIGNDQ